MDRLLLVRCPELLIEDEDGEVLRSFGRVIDASRYCPWVTAVRPGVCTLPARGPARFFGGESEVFRLVTEAVQAVNDGASVEVGIADGLFAAHLAAQVGVVVEPEKTAVFLAPWPVSVLDRPELEELLVRLGIRTLGAFAKLPHRHVTARFGTEGAICHRVAQGVEGELPGLRLLCTERRLEQLHNDAPIRVQQPGFWGGRQDADARAGQVLSRVQYLLEPEAVVVAQLQGGRSPLDQIRFVTWNGSESPAAPVGTEPWPGQIPSPAPATVYTKPLPIEVVGADRQQIVVTGRGALSLAPAWLSIDRGAWTDVVAWAGPWPIWERWWTPSRRRVAHLQVVTAGGLAHLVTAQYGGWWLSATYD